MRSNLLSLKRSGDANLPGLRSKLDRDGDSLPVAHSGGDHVTVMQPTESRQRDDLARAWRHRRCNSTSGRVLPQSKMSPVFVVIVDVVFQQSSQVPLVQNDHVVEQIPTHTSNPALGNAILPGTAKSSSDGLRAVLCDGRDDISRELRVAIEDEELVRLFISPSCAQLQYDPQGIWLTGHIAVQNLPTVVPNDEEAVQNSAGQTRHGEEIHGSDCFTVIAKKRKPVLGWIRILACTFDPARNRSFRDVETQLEQLPVDAGRSPGWVFCDHAKDQVAHFPTDWFSSHHLSSSRDPVPVQPKAGPMATNHGLRGDEDQ